MTSYAAYLMSSVLTHGKWHANVLNLRQMEIIKVGEREFLPLLDREKVLADVKKAFPAQLEMLRDLTNYGSNLIPRCYGSSDRQLKDIIAVATLLRQVVSMLDGFEVLLSNGSIYTAALQARALFEAASYIQWILLADGETKATYYYVHNLRRQRRWAERFQQGSPEATAFTALVPDLPALRDKDAIEHAAKTLNEIDGLLLQKGFAAANLAFNKCAPKNGRRDKAWYFPLGVRNLHEISSAVGRSAEYSIFYGAWSETMHSSNFTHHVRVGKEKTITFEPIRHLSGFGSLFTCTASTVLSTYHKVLQHYRPGELPAHARKYLDNWQKALMNVPTIKYG
jgi:hypothetical protein